MDIKITARHFKAHESLREYVFNAITKLERYYNGIVSADVILSYERSQNSLKSAEVHIKVYGAVLKANDKSEDYFKSIDNAMEKVERQIQKYKSRMHGREKAEIRRVSDKY